MTRPTRCSPFLFPVLVLSACGGDPPERPPDDEPAPPEAAEVVPDGPAPGAYAAGPVSDGGTIMGTVRFSGSRPAARTVPVGEGAEVCGASRTVDPVSVDAEGRLAGAVASLADIRRGAPRAAARPAPTIDQRDCAFVPHVLLAAVGEEVQVLNSDPLTHNVHTSSFENRSVNRTQPAGMSAIALAFDAPDRVKVQCDLHPWMTAWIVVTEHPYYAITGGAGTFVLSDVPPGTYALEIWHDAVGIHTESVTVTAHDTSHVSIALAGRG